MRAAVLKTLVLSMAILIAGSLGFASRWEWGFKTGFVRSQSHFSRDLPYAEVQSLNAFSIGAFLSNFFINDRLGIQPEIHYSVKGFDIIEEDLGEEISSRYKISYFEIPVLIAYRIPLRGRFMPGLVFGPYWGIAHKVTEVQTVFGNKEKRELDDNLKDTDVGLVFGGNLRYRIGSMDILLCVRYSLGFTSISKNIREVAYDFQSDDTIKNRALTLSIGLSFIPPVSR
jgi:hypothetical protein